MFNLICLQCGKAFEGKQPKAKYCCYLCRREALSKKQKYEPILCPYCGRKFTPQKYGQIYCSKKCSDKWHNDHSSYERATPMSVTKVCAICGKAFSTTLSYQKYCSPQCRKEAIILWNIRNDNLKYSEKSNPIIKELAEPTNKIRLKYGNKVINAWLISGFSDRLRDAIKERDNWRCFVCGSEVNLHVHHIIPRIQGGPHVPENLVTLCGGCHRSIENGDVEKAIKNCVCRALSN